MLADRLLQQGQRVGGLDRPVGMDAMALASAFAYQVEGPRRAPADALDQPLVRAVAKRPQLCRDLLASKRRMLPRKADDLRLQQALPLGLGLRAIAERRAADPQPPARGSPGTRQRGLDLRRNPAPALRAQRFSSSAISRAFVLSSWSASSFLSSVFSFSRSRRR